MCDDTPLIYTARGNLPISDLEYSTRWELTEDYVKLVEVYRLDGEVVRESAHVCSLRGPFADAQAAQLN